MTTGSQTRSEAVAAPDETTGPPEHPAPARRRRPRGEVWLRVLVAGAAGGGMVLAFPPYGVWPLAFLGPAVLVGLVRGHRARRGFGVGVTFGVAFFVPLLHWTGVYVGPAPWLILAGAQAVYLGLLGAGLTVVGRVPGWPVWSAALWVAEEALRDRAPFGGFPWGRLAFAESNSPLAWFAAWGGAPLVTFAVALGGSLLTALIVALIVDSGRRRLAVPAGGLVVLIAATALARPLAPQPSGAGTVRVALIQGNVPRLGLDFNAQRAAVLRNHVQATLDLAAAVRAGTQPQPQLVIWPENASDIDPLDNPDAGSLIDQAAGAIGVPILVGAVVDGPGPDHVTNAGIVWDPVTGPGAQYVKRHPVPFGEYIPLRGIARKVSKDVDLVARDMVAGGTPGRLQVGPVRLGDVICFEVAYDGIVRDAARQTGLLVVQTNNATFGHSNETYQQLAMSRLRAIEHGQTVLVASTSGVSAIIDPDGYVRDQSSVFTADLLAAAVPVRAGSTLATRLGALPEWLLVAVAGAALAAGVVAARQARQARRPPETTVQEPKEQEQA